MGAGPGDAGLITVRAVEVLKKADCVVYDKLANAEFLKYKRADAEAICVAKRTGANSVTQPEINKLLVELASEGKNIVRLKGGDPCIFGRGNEEAGLLWDNGIDFEIIPGITSGAAAAEYAGIALTDRRFSSKVVFVTGHPAEGSTDDNIDLPHLASFKGTIVFYMAMARLRYITTELIKSGMPGITPASVVYKATVGEQKTVTSDVANIAQACEENNIGAPAIVIIGPGARPDKKLCWLKNKPLFGKKILITRDEKGNDGFANLCAARHAVPIKLNTIKINSMLRADGLSEIISRITNSGWVIFTSANGVRFFFDYLYSNNKDARVLANAQVAAIGPITSGTLEEFGIRADFVPDAFTGEQLARQLCDFTPMKDKKILLLRSEQASKELYNLLMNAGAKVVEHAVYTTQNANFNEQEALSMLKKDEVDWVTFASPSAVKSFSDKINADIINESAVKVGAIGPVTAAELKNKNFKVDLQAPEHTLEGLLEAIEESYQ